MNKAVAKALEIVNKGKPLPIGGGASRRWDKGGGAGLKNNFGLKIMGSRLPGPSPGSDTALNSSIELPSFVSKTAVPKFILRSSFSSRTPEYCENYFLTDCSRNN